MHFHAITTWLHAYCANFIEITLDECFSCCNGIISKEHQTLLHPGTLSIFGQTCTSCDVRGKIAALQKQLCAAQADGCSCCRLTQSPDASVESSCRGRKGKGADCRDPYCSYHMHIKHCGGAYIKIKEPEKRPTEKPKAGSKRGRSLGDEGASKKPPPGNKTITGFFNTPGSAPAAAAAPPAKAGAPSQSATNLPESSGRQPSVPSASAGAAVAPPTFETPEERRKRCEEAALARLQVHKAPAAAQQPGNFAAVPSAVGATVRAHYGSRDNAPTARPNALQTASGKSLGGGDAGNEIAQPFMQPFGQQRAGGPGFVLPGPLPSQRPEASAAPGRLLSGSIPPAVPPSQQGGCETPAQNAAASLDLNDCKTSRAAGLSQSSLPCPGTLLIDLCSEEDEPPLQVPANTSRDPQGRPQSNEVQAGASGIVDDVVQPHDREPNNSEARRVSAVDALGSTPSTPAAASVFEHRVKLSASPSRPGTQPTASSLVKGASIGSAPASDGQPTVQQLWQKSKALQKPPPPASAGNSRLQQGDDLPSCSSAAAVGAGGSGYFSSRQPLGSTARDIIFQGASDDGAGPSCSKGAVGRRMTCPFCHSQWAEGEIDNAGLNGHIDECLRMFAM